MEKRALIRVCFVACAAFLFYDTPGRADDLLFTDEQADCAAKLIYQNECSSKEENLLYWNENETFPSLGIGHFIWYSKSAPGPYRESFPGLLDFIVDNDGAIPFWLTRLEDRHAPWRSREEFMADLSSEKMRELRDFLKESMRAQAQYILKRFQKVFPFILEDLSEIDRVVVKEKYDLLIQTPEGMFAMVDYVNFKGEGFHTDARYSGVGWGLAQVLLEMNFPDDPDKALEEFIAAAERVLERRVEHAPRSEVESKWLPGWKNRLKGYLQIDCR